MRDTQTRRDRETMAEWAATQDAYDRLLERRARRRRMLHRFAYFKPWPVAAIDEPVTAVVAPRDTRTPSRSLGATSGAAGSEPTSQPPVTTQGPGGARRFAGPAGPGEPQLAVSSSLSARGRRTASEKPGPATPHLPPPLSSRISAGITWT